MDNTKLTFYITRHGKTLLNTLDRVQGWCDSFLAPEGIETSRWLGKGLSTADIRSVYCSDLRRTRQTAETILEAMEKGDIPVIEMQGFREACFGSYESDHNSRLWMDVSLYNHYTSPSELTQGIRNKELTYREVLDTIAKIDKANIAENYDTVCHRSLKALNEVVEREKLKGTGDILIVSHGMTILVMMWALGAHELITDHLQNASVCKVVYQNEKFTVESVGDMSYLERGKTFTQL
ncbi:broad specificity phosphatase PhoE [Dysgonomonas sp. PH5-45]|uniref:histidine phosphatase family protein n=1 Tax=unclassified Dysgonomonas TaxID=2630389 RepID=UPI002475DDFA|nr:MULTISPECIES: histidine phosphatase family protein [unclassified Dysgonomonas]MDH6355312.1 broad specificity phosphatase PhoE [Dysgonomonas sp. PH5-45]MDH6388210.1 broad specificity phosphatase PhoE [Dysgonomonas sp. PH5-37]